MKIEGSKGLTFENNHMEGGAQIDIHDSMLSLRSNYFIKGSRPNIRISGHEKSRSVITIENCIFIFLSNTQKGESITDKRTRIQNIADVDIQLNSLSCVNLSNVFRSDYVVGFESLTPLGVKIIKDDGSPFTEFDNNSFYCSRKSLIYPGYFLRGEFEVPLPNTPTLYHLEKSGGVTWFNETGMYRYFYQIVWDLKRGIFRTTNNKTLFPVDSEETQVYLQENSFGVLLVAAAQSNGNTLIVRLFRECVRDKNSNEVSQWEVVTVPISGANMLYDNGFSVCGFRWQPTTAPQEADMSHSFSFLILNTNRVSAWTAVRPTSIENWGVGDLIYNVGTDASWNDMIVK